MKIINMKIIESFFRWLNPKNRNNSKILIASKTASVDRTNQRDVIKKTIKSKSPKACPYCCEELEKMPKRKQKCPFCKEPIILKRRPGRKIKELFTEQEAKEIELEWQKINEYESLISDLKGFGITENQFKKKKKEFKGEVNDRDTAWSLLNENVLKEVQKGNFHSASDYYWGMGRFLINEGKSAYKMQFEAIRMTLFEYRKEGMKKVEISWTGNGCESCRELNGKMYTIDKALSEMPLPNKACTMDVFEKNVPWCRCIYSPKY